MTAARNFAALALVFTLAGSTFAQSGDYPQPLVGDNMQAQHHASTVQEGYQRGAADLVRAQGQYNYNTAAARLINEDAYSRHLDNEIKKVDTWFGKKERWQYYQEKNAPRPLTSEQISRINQRRAPKRLAADQLDQQLGAIYWPVALNGEEYADLRAAVEELFEARTPGNSGKGTQNYRDIVQATAELRDVLKDKINDLPGQEYTEAKRFIDGLAHEARFAASGEAIARN